MKHAQIIVRFVVFFILFATGCFLPTISFGDAAGAAPPESPEVTSALKPYLDEFKIAGIDAVIADRQGKILFRNLLGHADVQSARPMSENDVYWVASMTKMFTGAAIMMLVDEGKLNLDDPVTKYIPVLDRWKVALPQDDGTVRLVAPRRPVTIRHLLSHTSGLAGGSEFQQVFGADTLPIRFRSLASITGPLQWQPGEKYSYGNQGMNVAARVVEILSGVPYEEFLQKRFFDPLEMNDTTFWPDRQQQSRLVVPYGPNREKNAFARGEIGYLSKPYEDRINRFPEAGGGLFSTTADMLRFGLMLVNDGQWNGRRYLSPDAIAELRKKQTGQNRENYSFGYHLRNGMFGHDGALGTDLSVHPETGLVAVFMVQSAGSPWEARDRFVQTARNVYQTAQSTAKSDERSGTEAKRAISRTFQMDESGISREALENYLDHAVTMTELLTVDPFGVDGPYPGKEDDLRLIEHVGAKFIGRAIYRWGREQMLTNREFLDQAKKLATRIHESDPEIVLQGCLFEIVTPEVEEIPVPARAFEILGREPEERNFDYEKMLSPDGKFVNHWGRSSVPDITQTETQLWFLFLAETYFDVGCEALHLGQTALIGMNDPELRHWDEFCRKLRTLAKIETRRGWVLLDAHTPTGGMVIEGRSILDFNSFPLRIKEVPDKPLEGVLEAGYLDALFLRSHGGVTPSGWKCDSLPFLVEFDNFGRSPQAGTPTPQSHFIWGYDEISWFYKLDENRRKDWLKYAAQWVRRTDPNAHLQMPVSRLISLGRGEERKFRANTRSDAVPNGLNLEETIKELFSTQETKN